MPTTTDSTVGALAEASGLTVRTLHPWDEIGLLRPAERSAAGHRRYSSEDVRRLYRIVALRGQPFRVAAARVARAVEHRTGECVRHCRDVSRPLASDVT